MANSHYFPMRQKLNYVHQDNKNNNNNIVMSSDGFILSSNTEGRNLG